MEKEEVIKKEENLENKIEKSKEVEPIKEEIVEAQKETEKSEEAKVNQEEESIKEEIVEAQKETEKSEEAEVYQEVEPIKKKVRTDSYFDGSLIELIGWKLLAFLITIVSFGIAGAWGKCMIYSYKIKHTVYNGKRLKFEGTGGDLFVNRFKWALLTIITFGIYALFVPIKKTKWVISNIHFEDEEFKKEESFFDGNTIQLIGINLLCTILNIITLGLLAPFTTCLKLRWIIKHTVINRKKLVFKGRAIGLFGKQMLWNFLTIITFGIFALWLPIKIIKWKTKHTHIKVVGEEEKKDKSLFIAIPILVLAVAIIVSIVPNVIKGISNSEGILEGLPVFEGNGGWFLNGNSNSSNKDSMTESAISSQKTSTSNNTSSSNKGTNNKTSSNKTNSSTSTTTSSSKKTSYPTLKEIAGDYGINITEEHYVKGKIDKSQTQEASGIEKFTRSGEKIEYLGYGYKMKYNQSTGYAVCTDNKSKIEGYFKYKNGKVRAELTEYIYENDGSTIKIKRKITGNKIY